MNISQPSLSQYIKKIEDELEILLFERCGNSLRLTDAGRAYIETGKKILELETNFQDKLNDITENKSGSITIGTAPFRSVTLMPKVVKKFKELYNDFQIIIKEMTTDELSEGLENGEFDFCITLLPVNTNLFSYEIIMEEELLLAVQKGSRTEENLLKISSKTKKGLYNTIDLKYLTNEDFIMLTNNQVMQKSLITICEKYNLNFKKSVEVKSIESQIEMVAAGIGCAIVPSGITGIERLNDKLSYFSFCQEHPKRSLAVVYQKSKHLTNPMKDFIKILKEK